MGPRSVRESAARGYARALSDVPVPVHACGLAAEGADGRRYLDCASGTGTLSVGHNHPVAREAICGVLESGAPRHALDDPNSEVPNPAGMIRTSADAFRANRLAMAAGSASLAFVCENGPAGRAAQLSARVLAQLRRLVGEFAGMGDVRGRGLKTGVDFVAGSGAGGWCVSNMVALQRPVDGPCPVAPGVAGAVEAVARGQTDGSAGVLAGVLPVTPSGPGSAPQTV